MQDIVDVEEPGTLKPDVHESGLHAGQDPDDPPEIDIAHQAFLGWSLKMEFGQITIFDKRNSYLVSP